jgi:hypothetical protein
MDNNCEIGISRDMKLDIMEKFNTILALDNNMDIQQQKYIEINEMDKQGNKR